MTPLPKSIPMRKLLLNDGEEIPYEPHQIAKIDPDFFMWE